MRPGRAGGDCRAEGTWPRTGPRGGLLPDARRLAEAFGADEVLDPAEGSPHERWSDFGIARTVMERIGAGMLGAAVQDPVIFEAVGVPGMLQSLLAEAPPHSRIVVVGVCMHTDSIEPFMAVTKEMELRFSFGYTPDEFAADAGPPGRRRPRRRPARHVPGRPGRRAGRLRDPAHAGRARQDPRDTVGAHRIPRRTDRTLKTWRAMTTIDADGRLRFGFFLAPFHPVGQNPTLALERDLQLIEHLDALGFDEAWFGEHHSAGYEIIASPEVFIAAAARRTKQIRLGTGVSSLPYHHPFMLADRMVLLDHLTRGHVMLGVGPGALPSDAFMMGIDPAKQR